ncbi:BolA family protein [Aquisalimonas sp. 2447]|uniref:BolA family protein n=1 Tax=Aquisalimonas sp. 2447 TaxID=2740807 RepID=UPI0035303B5C
MMQPEAIKDLIEQGLPECHAQVEGDGAHFQAVIVSPAFEGKLPIARQRLVNSVLQERFDSGELHALSMRTLTPEQWQKEQG